MTRYCVRSGDCISNVAHRFGFHPNTIWDHAENAELKKRRGDGHILLKGDQLFIPKLRRREEVGATEQRHRFVRKGVPESLELVIQDDEGNPRPNVAYEMRIGLDTRFGRTDDEGVIRESIPPDATRATLIVEGQVLEGEGSEGDEGIADDEYELELGHLDPINDVHGVQQRLQNLGFDPGALDGDLGEKTREQLCRFQAREGMAETGALDNATREALKKAHGS